ncbi:MAG: family 20 glycosylhydrolase, partial [Anaerolineae bacterium]|nr:family 20 glycosylhydrolase [Anaerolineae bacterium]
MDLFPTPLSVTYQEGWVDLSGGVRLIAPPFSELRPSSVQDMVLAEAGVPVRFQRADVAPEGYAVAVMPEGIEISFSDERGALNGLGALATLARSGRVRAQRVIDEPGLALRVFHLDLKDQMLSFDYILRLIDRLASLRYNVLLVEYEDKFPYSGDIIPAHPERLTLDEVATLIEHCRERGIEVVPCVPTLGHLEFVLYHRPELAETDARYQVCPLKPEALALIKRMIDEVLALHPTSRFLHVGGDETWYLGRCPACRRVAAREGVAALYGRFMRDVLAHVLERGKRPWLWADMALAHPDVLTYIPRESVFVDWEYTYYGEE